MNFFVFLFVIQVFSVQAAFRVKVFAEYGAEVRALEFLDELRRAEPFKQLVEKGALEIVETVSLAENTNCRGGHLGIPRLAQCDLKEIKRLCDANLCPIYTSFPDIGAGGAPFPIVSSSFPWTTMFHELVHTFGFMDEYAYTKSEAPIYCRPNTSWVNGVLSKKNSFPTAKEALGECLKKIPWCKQVVHEGRPVVQKLANGRYQIGSPIPSECPSVELGVYLGGACQSLYPTWRPYFCPTVMGYPSLGEDLCPVQKRHSIIQNSPNLLPSYYQSVLFKMIAPAFIFEERELPVLGFHTYGIPEVDRLSGQSGDVNLCLK